MKKNFLYAVMSAIALTGAVGFSACSSSDEIVDNPNYNPEDNSVKTAFTLSVGDLKSPVTRMSASSVQKETQQGVTTFNGMTDIYLFPAKAAITGNTETSESYIHLADFDAFNLTTAKGRVYNNVDLSVGVSNFLFYAAEKSNVGNGKLKASYLPMAATEFNGTSEWAETPIQTGSTVGSITFDLVPIQGKYIPWGATVTDDAKKAQMLAFVKEEGATTIAPLNAVDVVLKGKIDDATTANAEGVVTELTAIQKVLRNDVSANATADYKPYAGSSRSIKTLMTMLYNTLQNKTATLTVGETNYAEPILTAITNSFDVEGNENTGYTLKWKNNNDPKFPYDATASLGLPDGAVAVQYIGTDDDAPFEYVQPSVDGMEVASIDKYTYPARLYYTVNTPAMVKDAEYLSTATSQEWNTIRAAYSDGAIKSSTRSVIMKDQVQYAVGRLDVAVRVKNETINDNSKEAPQPVTVPTDGYELTGVLIGGQKQVGWDFTPISTADDMTIWDNVMTSTIKAVQGEAYSSANSTLALETPEYSSTVNGKINIALEFVNTGNDFCGVDHNVIPAGTKFYLVACLDPSTNTTYYEQNPETSWDEGTNLIKQVIKQDYVTTVNLTIGENSLKKAYNVVPDLRSPKLEFGLSVDLHWRNGITFEQTF